ncbi:TMEM165/GDT1 family protein [Asticcacaulis sp. SL142]|uniref:TMEM165/GDT1 family protein n=1 Tax=Asticcacaulis sp. SL142 TaxID=2995155 RepID=UPI00226CABEB|nr:TMEM165/GDT1 family protein [Asticcacaulis sp. SL142]WAC49929.1 TMEM165/GDT1 family protein [Asticcacaulis sp. SL142]
MLAARYQKPAPIIFGIFVATLINHAFAAWVGTFVGGLGIDAYMPWLVAIAFIGLGLWILVPDKIEEGEGEIKKRLRPVCHHHHYVLSGRNGRQDPDRDRGLGRSV